ncbi:MAG TPA: hypothetical protein VK631_02215, partial [Solirubrobacteraceae bacterium]|nr:hypothetical protein [Solirubrobacteraceae bacterium]
VRIERAWDEPGVKGVELRVVDGHGAVGVARADVVVGAPPPAARLTWSPAEPRIGDEVILDASASGGQPVRHEWDLDGDGSFETDGGASPTWALRVLAPTQRVAVRVRTYEGAMDTTAVTIAAAPAAVAPPLERPPGAALPTLDPPAGTAGANVPLAAVDRRGPAMPVTVRRRVGRGGAVRVRLRCPIPEERCAGQVWLQSRRGGRRVTGARAFAGRGGRLFDLRLGLGDAARRRLRNGHTVPAQLVVRARDAAGNARTRRAAVRIAPGPMEDA